MRLGKPVDKRSKQIVWGIILFLALLFVIFFRREILWVITAVPPDVRIDETIHNPVLNPFDFILIGFTSFFLVFALWIVMISFQAILPITNLFQDPLKCLLEVYRSCWHLLLYMFHLHGPAIFVKDGKENATSEDWKRENWPGVVVVDFNSAVVLEERNSTPGLPGAFIQITMLFLQMFGLCDGKESPRVCGAGITFTRPRERVRGTVDLRKQVRKQFDVRCYTREGIELNTSISAAFTIGQDPDVLQVTYIGDNRPEFLKVVTLEQTKDGGLELKNFNEDPDELDSPDRKEINAYALQNSFLNQGGLIPFAPLPKPSNQVKFDRERVFNAVFAQARSGNQEVIPWTDLPTRVAAGLYREILSHINYDDIYDVKKEKDKFPLPQYKAKLRFAMRNNGILSYRLVFDCRGKPLVKGRIYRPEDLMVSPVMQLKNSKVLRDRGIKIIASGFSDLIPVNEAIYMLRLDSWRAGWERELNIHLASRDLEAMRERSRARVEAQQDLWYSLSQLFQQREYTDEALAIRVLQSLETVAADPKTYALLPEDTIRLLNHIHTILLPQSISPNQALPPGGKL